MQRSVLGPTNLPSLALFRKQDQQNIEGAFPQMFMKPWWIHIAQGMACNRLGTACISTACTVWITLQNYSLLRVG